ncbi:MAG: hypothetical protein J5643_10945 [Lachnospiraceae bacterium]|nr:hypothetical protein [Lachnospiraceae bacterium]
MKEIFSDEKLNELAKEPNSDASTLSAAADFIANEATSVPQASDEDVFTWNEEDALEADSAEAAGAAGLTAEELSEEDESRYFLDREDGDEDYDYEDVSYVAAEVPVSEPVLQDDPYDAPTEEDFYQNLKDRQKRSRRRLVFLLGILGALIIVASLKYYYNGVNGWHKTKEGTYYIQDRLRLVGLYQIDGGEYLFDGNGLLIEGPAEEGGKAYYSTLEGILKGVVEIDGEEFYFSEEDGVLRRGFYTEDGVQYYRNSHGFVEAGVREINGKVYYIGEDGRLLEGWAHFENGVRYFPASDHNMYTGIREVDGEQYYFDWNGYVRKGFIREDGTCYYAEPQNGALQFGRVTVDGAEYYLNEDGAVLEGIGRAEDKDWYFRENAFVLGWVEDDNGRFYSNENGLVTGDQKIDGKGYYFEPDYRLARGWITRETGRYYFDNDGVMLYGWQTIDGKNYRFSDEGVLYVGEHEFDGVKYLFADDGAFYDGFTETEIGRQYFDKGYLKTGITKIEDKYYYLDSQGIARGGKQTVNGLLAMYNADGSAQTGWKTIDDKKYYLAETGVMLAGNVAIGGKRYYLSREGGFLEPGWHTDNGKFYSYKDGTIAVGAVKIDGKLYAFSDTGYLVTKEGLQKIGGKQRYVYSDGTIAVSTEMTINGKKYEIDANGVAQVKFSTINNNNLDAYLDYVISDVVGSKDIKALYKWVQKTVPTYSYYSEGNAGNPRVLACEAINNRRGACWHYAALMTLLLQRAGYNAKIIKGGGHTYSVHHWTAVQVSGQWLYIDAMRLERTICLVDQATLDSYQFTYKTPGIGPQPGNNNYTDKYYYGYTKP